VIWIILLSAALVSLMNARWEALFVSLSAFVLTTLPILFSSRLKIVLPNVFLGALSAFVFATLFLGEVFDFYERFWWWDLMLHGFSAMGFGIIGFLFAFYLFEGDRYAAPPWALSLIAFCFALSIGALWEIFEFSMDQFFGLNMQKNGLFDTMWDLIVDTFGALIGATAGFFWLKGRNTTLNGLFEEFVQRNRGLYRKLRKRVSRDK
jgi:hypothetical protein